MNILSIFDAPFSEIIIVPKSMTTIPLISNLFNLSRRNIIPIITTNNGFIFAKNDTTAGFETVFIDKKKNKVPPTSSDAMASKAKMNFSLY